MTLVMMAILFGPIALCFLIVLYAIFGSKLLVLPVGIGLLVLYGVLKVKQAKRREEKAAQAEEQCRRATYWAGVVHEQMKINREEREKERTEQEQREREEYGL